MVGSVIAADLASEHHVTIADYRSASLLAAQTRLDRLGRRCCALRVDLTDQQAITALAKSYDVVCGAASSHIALGVLQAVIESGRPYADIAFMNEDPLELHEHAKSRGSTCVLDMGVAPGMSHVLASHLAQQAQHHYGPDACRDLEIYVGGLPVQRRWPFEYQAGFAPSDVIEEYLRPARYIRQSQIVTKPALSEPELLDFPGVGTLEAFNTDGLRSITRTFLGEHAPLRVPNIIEKTLRYPGHIELMRVLRHLGLMSDQPLKPVKTPQGMRFDQATPGEDHAFSPRDLLSHLLFPHWTYQPGEQDLTVMRVLSKSAVAGQLIEDRFDLHLIYDQQTHTTSMAKSTALPCCAIARMHLDGSLKAAGFSAGIITPEMLGLQPQVVSRLLADQASRGVHYTRSQLKTPL
jgi:lysine 6-dehydrogenase